MVSSILLSILLFYGILIIVNIPAPFIGLKFKTNRVKNLWYEPPGYVIPIVWFLLFTRLGFSRHSLIKADLEGLQWWLFALAFLCATYACYTLGLAKLNSISALWFGLFGNLVVILFTIILIITLLPLSREAAWHIFPIIIWTFYTTLIVLGQMKQGKLIHL
jgi:tryptophan-rich sensory protein